MEAGGLALGAVSLVSLIKDCVDLYSMFKSAQNLDKDIVALEIKLEIEKTLFFKWPERVGLFRQDQEEAIFSDARTRDVVMGILKKIRDLLSDGDTLQNTYGLQSIISTDKCGNDMLSNDSPTCISQFRQTQLFEDFRRLNFRDAFSGNRSSKLVNIAKKVNWVIGDKEKFNRLIADLSYFNKRLIELTPGSTSLGAEDLHHIRNIPKLDEIVEALQSNRSHQEIVIEARSNAIQSRVLDCLWFRWQDDRRLTVKEAHAKTFSWVLDPESENETWGHLPTWLKGGSGIYWLQGKAGSGKSTLMKFLHDDERTQEYLKLWADKSELIFASFFFYAQGQSEQKSQVGLLRSLLHQVLNHDPTLTKTVLPNAWREACRDYQRKAEDLSIPSVAEMTKALKDICKLFQVTKKMFFLIDGLDEYEGDDIEVAEFISGLGEVSNVKVLVSSRPHSTFFRAFRGSPSMDLPRLTKRDIVSYIDDTVASHPYMKDLSVMDPNAANSITTSLVERASGVFLWVVLVCRSVIEGCDEHEATSDLQARVDESPREVEELLKRIIETIQPRWEDEAMKIMHLVYTNQTCPTLLPIFGLHLICEQGYSSDIHSSEIKAWGPYTREETESRCSIMEARLRSRCRGLIEVKRLSENLDTSRFDWFDLGDDNRLSIRNCTVNFMHRTVYDLLSQQSVFYRHFGKIIEQGFNSYFVLCNLWCQLAATCHQYQSCRLPHAESKPCLRIGCLNYARMIIRRGHSHGCAPDILLHCVSRIQYVCGIFLHDEFFRHTKHVLHDWKCRNYYSDMSAVVAIAAECALHKVIQFVYESNVSLDHLLYQPLSLDSLESCQYGEKQEAGSPDCQKDQSYYKIETEQGALNIKSPLAFHCLLTPFLRQCCRYVYYVAEDLDRLRVIEFILENDSLDSRETKALLDGFDVLCDRQGEHCHEIWKDIQTFLHSRLGTTQ